MMSRSSQATRLDAGEASAPVMAFCRGEAEREVGSAAPGLDQRQGEGKWLAGSGAAPRCTEMKGLRIGEAMTAYENREEYV